MDGQVAAAQLVRQGLHHDALVVGDLAEDIPALPEPGGERRRRAKLQPATLARPALEVPIVQTLGRLPPQPSAEPAKLPASRGGLALPERDRGRQDRKSTRL